MKSDNIHEIYVICDAYMIGLELKYANNCPNTWISENYYVFLQALTTNIKHQYN